MSDKKTIVINLFGGPGTGKSTTAAKLFAALKERGINCELVSEYAKHATWRNDKAALSDQLYITAKQNFKLHVLNGKVDYIVTDSPLLLGINYCVPNYLGGSYKKLVQELYDSYTNVNVFICRQKAYNPIGRNQTEEEAKEIDKNIKKYLDNSGQPYFTVDGNTATEEILEKMGFK